MKKIIAFFPLLTVFVGFSVAQAQLPENGGFRQEGIASWYGEEFQGRQTASGELFDPKLFTAAHPTLPFGTMLTVTNLTNSSQVQVRINDRGPFVPSRIIDVSKAAAEKLDMLVTGTAKVLIEIAPRSYTPVSPELPTAEGERPAEGYPLASNEIPAEDMPAPNPTPTTRNPSATPQPARPVLQQAQPRQPVASASQSQQPVRQGVPPAPQSAAPRSSTQNPPAYSPANPAGTGRQTTQAPMPRQPAASSPQVSSPPAAPAAATPTQIQPLASQNTWRPYTNPAQANPAGAPAARPQATPQTSTPARQAAPPPSAPARPAAPQAAVPQQMPSRNVPSAPPPQAALPPQAAAPPPVAAAPRAAPQSAQTAPAVPQTAQRLPPATILGGPIVPGRLYRIQVGSFKEASNAMRAYNQLTSVGFAPQWERYEDMFRVVLTGVRTEDIPAVATKLGAAGFDKAVARLEGVEFTE